MFKRLFLPFIVCSIGILLSCNNKRTFIQSDYQKSYLIFGQGGGITGLRIEYIMTEDGAIYRKHMPSDSLEFIKNTGRAFAKQTFGNYVSLGLDQMKCYEPGDLYYYLEHHTQSDVHRLVWGRPGFIPPEIVVSYFNNLYRTAKKTD